VSTFAFKDDNRTWVYLKVEREDRFEPAPGGEERDYYWSYEIRAEVGSAARPSLIYRGSILGQYDERPALHQFILNYHSYVTRLLVNFAKFGPDLSEISDLE